MNNSALDRAETIHWICQCGIRNDDEIDPVYGPFNSCTCGGCGKSFDQDAVQKVE